MPTLLELKNKAVDVLKKTTEIHQLSREAHNLAHEAMDSLNHLKDPTDEDLQRIDARLRIAGEKHELLKSKL